MISPFIFLLVEDGRVVRNILCKVRLSTFSAEWQKKNQSVRVPFSQRLGTSMCVTLLMRSAVLPMAVIRKNTPFLRTASKPLYAVRFALYFSHQRQAERCFSSVKPLFLLAVCLVLPKLLGNKGGKKIQTSFFLFLTDSWVEGGTDGFSV